MDDTHYRKEPPAAEVPAEVAGEYGTALQSLSDAVGAYKPVDAKGTAHDDMSEIRDDLLAMVTRERKMVAALAAA